MASRCGAAARARYAGPSTFTATIAGQSDTSAVRTSPGTVYPALATTPSIRPYRLAQSSTTRSVSAQSPGIGHRGRQPLPRPGGLGERGEPFLAAPGGHHGVAGVEQARA